MTWSATITPGHSQRRLPDEAFHRGLLDCRHLDSADGSRFTTTGHLVEASRRMFTDDTPSVRGLGWQVIRASTATIRSRDQAIRKQAREMKPTRSAARPIGYGRRTSRLRRAMARRRRAEARWRGRLAGRMRLRRAGEIRPPGMRRPSQERGKTAGADASRPTRKNIRNSPASSCAGRRRRPRISTRDREWRRRG